MKKGLTQYVEQIKEDLQIMRIKYEGCLDRVSFRKKIYDIQTFKTMAPKSKPIWDKRTKKKDEKEEEFQQKKKPSDDI